MGARRNLRAPSFFHILIEQFADVAQWLEQGFHKAKVAGSNPAVGTRPKIKNDRYLGDSGRNRGGAPEDGAAHGLRKVFTKRGI